MNKQKTAAVALAFLGIAISLASIVVIATIKPEEIELPEITPFPETPVDPVSTPDNGKRVIETACSANTECVWVSTNCCSEHAGAYWECINKTESEIFCPPNPVCLQVISPRPENECECIEGKCTAAN